MSRCTVAFDEELTFLKIQTSKKLSLNIHKLEMVKHEVLLVNQLF